MLFTVVCWMMFVLSPSVYVQGIKHWFCHCHRRCRHGHKDCHIWRSRHLSELAAQQAVEFGIKLASICLEWSGTGRKHHQGFIDPWRHK